MPAVKFKTSFRPAAGIMTALLLALLHSGCETYEMDSLWLEDPVTVDGDSADWRGSLYYLEDEKASIGVKNDGQNLYICLLTQEPVRGRQALNQGLILWFDPAGGKAKSFGINYPIGAGGEFRPGQGMQRPDQDPEEMRERMRQARLDSLDTLRILDRDGEETHRLKKDELEEMEIAVQSSQSLFVYELKIPLNGTENQPFKFQAPPGRTIGVGLEIPKLDRAGMRGARPGGGMGGMPGGGGRGGRPGGGMGGRSGRPGGGRGAFNPDSLLGMKLWTKIKLASEEISSPPFS
jgi:hypothetical protein